LRDRAERASANRAAGIPFARDSTISNRQFLAETRNWPHHSEAAAKGQKAARGAQLALLIALRSLFSGSAARKGTESLQVLAFLEVEAFPGAIPGLSALASPASDLGKTASEFIFFELPL
jgi:hypothetical protein